jgi:dipeptidyl-peptidase-3
LAIKLGLLPNERAALAHYRSFARNALLLLRKYEEADGVGEAHDRARHLIVNFMIRNGYGVNVLNVEGKTYYRVKNLEAMREGVGKLLAEIQRIKANGDYPAAKRLIEDYAVRFKPALRDEVVARYKALGVPAYSVALRPVIVPVLENGEVIDAKLYEPADLLEENLIYSGLLRKIKFVRFKNVSPAIRDANGMEKPHKEAKGSA